MRAKMILPAALTLVLATATGASAQQMQYDRTGDHMLSYGAQQVVAGPTRTHAERRAARQHGPTPLQVPIDRTGAHMLYSGPVAQ